MRKEKVKKFKAGIYIIPLILPESLEEQRDKLEQTFIAAQRRLQQFAKRNGWGNLVKENFTDRAEIFDGQDKLMERAFEITNAPLSTEFPKQFSACLEYKIFMSVSPQLYSQIYPEDTDKNAFEKLISHEMAHRLHIRILNGNEEAMGPIWFFEGFALHAAGQFEKYNPKMETAEVWNIVESEKRESYRKYAPVFRYFLEKASIRELIAHAGNKDFFDWLRKI
jgi:hypothetical protein